MRYFLAKLGTSTVVMASGSLSEAMARAPERGDAILGSEPSTPSRVGAVTADVLARGEERNGKPLWQLTGIGMSVLTREQSERRVKAARGRG